ncbi:hypothetical protein P154DRAFT_620465 [Amniculicola lignicola CBS 123094]|uniref:Stc1 domain-containing protein n=1 Tax=Amniculicola lignicola CBS 123094 TaxID=1392246 RepID=A0A6A5WLW4_9PLEO|nr:hypothetical protein P154DRAFT_620465 [Amniculicola lignicola CBS 123094]
MPKHKRAPTPTRTAHSPTVFNNLIYKNLSDAPLPIDLNTAIFFPPTITTKWSTFACLYCRNLYEGTRIPVVNRKPGQGEPEQLFLCVECWKVQVWEKEGSRRERLMGKEERPVGVGEVIRGDEGGSREDEFSRDTLRNILGREGAKESMNECTDEIMKESEGEKERARESVEGNGRENVRGQGRNRGRGRGRWGGVSRRLEAIPE